MSIKHAHTSEILHKWKIHTFDMFLVFKIKNYYLLFHFTSYLFTVDLQSHNEMAIKLNEKCHMFLYGIYFWNICISLKNVVSMFRRKLVCQIEKETKISEMMKIQKETFKNISLNKEKKLTNVHKNYIKTCSYIL